MEEPLKQRNAKLTSGRGPFSLLKPKAQLLLVAVLINIGFYPTRFRFKFLIDQAIILAALLFPISWIADDRNYLWPLPVYLTFCMAIFLSRKLWIALGLPYFFSHPDLAYFGFFKMGGIMISSLGPLVIGDFGILPLKVFQGIAGKRPNNSADDKL